jgi:hypothetical protein
VAERELGADDSLGATAIHEAGHAVIAYEFHRMIKDVSIGFDGARGTLGRCELEDLDSRTPEGARTLVLCYYGGPQAEILYRVLEDGDLASVESGPRRGLMEMARLNVETTAEKDYSEARALLRRLPAEDTEESLKETAFRLVKQHWRAIVKVADELKRSGKLGYDEVATIVESQESGG